MKSYNQMANDVLYRVDMHNQIKKRKQRTLKRTLIPAVSLCLVAVIGFGVWKISDMNSQPDITLNDAIYEGIKDNFDELNGESPDNPAANNKFIFNEADTAPDIDSKQLFALMINDFVKMTRDELNAYYGVNIFVELPQDLTETQNEAFGIYRRSNGEGEVYWDQNSYSFADSYGDDGYSREITVTAKKGSLPYNCFVDSGKKEKSVINNVEVLMGKSESVCFAEFMYQNVGFYIESYNLTQDEFITAVTSIVK